MTKLSYRQVLVGQRPAAIQGLDEIFEELYERGRGPDEADLGMTLVERARAYKNYIPKLAANDFAEALLREYRKYVGQRLCGCKPQPVDYGTWRGHPREQIPWFPTVAAELCDGCGVCLKLCQYGVLAPTPVGKVEAVEPFKCVVGCNSCANICKPKAITFPPRTILDAFQPGK
jgi:NAD-dependent dihydropyrimidine dehydrogenase PreA subunit